MSYTFHLWHIPVALGAAYIIHGLCILFQVARREIAAVAAFRKYVIAEERKT